MSTETERISELVKENPSRKLQSIMHIVNVETLTRAHKAQPTGKAAGVDKMTKEQYEENLEENLRELIQRMKTFSYRPQPVRRTYIPKENGKERPLGIPAYEDKLVQSVMADILNAIYEPKFCEISYGYRQGKSCHGAVKQLGKQLMSYTNWVVDADIKGFFDNISHEWMMKFLEHDISDKNFLRYVKRFLKSGMMEEGKRLETDKGAPQGGIISPVLANVYLHYALDLWFEKGVKKKAKGYCAMIRYADDTVFCFQHENEARAFYRAFTDRLSKFGLEVSSEKTKIIRFGRFAKEHGSKETFDFLGFTATGVTTRKGKYQPQFLASKKKLKAKKQAVKKWLRENRHEKINTLIKRLNQKLRGLYNYYGIQGNSRRLYGFYWYIRQQLKTVLNKRSQKDKTTWERLQTILKYTPVLAPRIAAGQY